MNIPNVYRKAVEGFIIPPRTFFQMFVSACQGTFSLFDESNRSAFIEKLDGGTINEGVLSQATAGPMIMLSLFHDLQNPLFKQNSFNPSEFLEGVGPALENFHNVAGSLENQLHNLALGTEEKEKSLEGAEKDEDTGSKSDEESVDHKTLSFGNQSIGGTGFLTPESGKGAAKILNHDWMDDAKKEPNSLAGQLSRMVTGELFQIHQISAKTQFLLQDHSRNIKFEEGSCSVNNVALLSARAYLCREKEIEDDVASAGHRYETLEADAEGGDSAENGVGVAAQMEIIYDVTQEFVVNKPRPAPADDGGDADKQSESETLQTTIVSVATLEAWLKDGPEDGELRWKLALYRPAYEFPGLQQAY